MVSLQIQARAAPQLTLLAMIDACGGAAVAETAAEAHFDKDQLWGGDSGGVAHDQIYFTEAAVKVRLHQA